MKVATIADVDDGRTTRLFRFSAAAVVNINHRHGHCHRRRQRGHSDGCDNCHRDGRDQNSCKDGEGGGGRENEDNNHNKGDEPLQWA